MTTRIGIFILVSSIAGAQSVYRDPDGRFTVQVPTGWQGAKVPNRASTAAVTKR
jgi:hypothetical protein